MKNIHLLPTDKLSRLRLDDGELVLGNSKLCQNTINYKYQHIYITSDEQIKDGDWMIRGNEQPTLVTPNFFWDFGVRYYKIILTTDQDLIGVQAIDDEFLEWFVKNPSCEKVEVYEVGGKLFAEPITPQEQSILSIEDRARKSANNLWIETDQREFTGHYMGFIAGWEEQEEQLLPIIKELGEALKEIQEANTGGVINTHWMQNHIQTTLDKYKQYL